MAKTPEEIAALKAKYASANADKDKAKADKKAKYAEANADANMPVCKIGIPWEWDMGRVVDGVPPANTQYTARDGRWWKHISNEDLALPQWQDYIARVEWNQRVTFSDSATPVVYEGPYKRSIVRY